MASNDPLPALRPSRQFEKRRAREMTFVVGAGSFARNILNIDQCVSVIRGELISIASDVMTKGGESRVTFSVSYDETPMNEMPAGNPSLVPA